MSSYLDSYLDRNKKIELEQKILRFTYRESRRKCYRYFMHFLHIVCKIRNIVIKDTCYYWNKLVRLMIYFSWTEWIFTNPNYLFKLPCFIVQMGRTDKFLLHEFSLVVFAEKIQRRRLRKLKATFDEFRTLYRAEYAGSLRLIREIIALESNEIFKSDGEAYFSRRVALLFFGQK